MTAFIKNRIGTGLVVLLAIIPAVIWVSIEPLGPRLFSVPAALISIGQVSGLVGMALFSLVIILSSRIKLLDNIFWGLNKVYVSHHNLGAISFSLLLLHPSALAVKYALASVQTAFNFIIADNPVTLLGEASLLIMMFLLILTFFSKLPYEKWKFTHKFLGLAFILGSIHSLMVYSDISKSQTLRGYMIILGLLAVSSILYRSIFHKFLVKKYDYAVEEVKEISANTAEITMSAKGERMEFEPGQFIFIKFEDDSVGREIHPFSMSSPPQEDNLKIVVKALGDFTGRLKLLKKGTEARIEGPFGKFSYKNYPGGKKQIWIAGGIGATPFLSMAKSLGGGADSGDYEIDFYYCANKKEELYFLGDLMKISEARGNFRVIPFCSDEKGTITANFVNKQSGGVGGKEIFICGPMLMMKSLEEQFLKLGAKGQGIHYEEFKLY